jgi:phage terminase large subunit GpA-like protein
MKISLPGYEIEISPTQMRDWSRWFMKLADKLPHKKPSMLISDHAQKYRVMPPGSRFPGRLDLSRTPYLIEPMDNMSPMSPVQRNVSMKCAQSGWTMACIECVICYYIGYHPADQLMLSAGDRIIRRWAERRMEPAIDSYGYRDFISAQSSRKGNKQTGDSIYTKQYYGGQLDFGSAASASNMRSTDKRILYRDEIDGSKEELDTGEGNWLEVSEARTIFWGELRKIMDISTPTIDGSSPIQELHAQGDQRVWRVPCPKCHKYQEMKFRGFKLDTKAGELVQVYYECDHCHDAIFEHEKRLFQAAGRWEPTNATPSDPLMRSYHLAAWNAPSGTLTWKQIYQRYQKAKADGTPNAMKSFVNLYLGRPYRQKHARPKLENVIELRSDYKSGTVPDKVLFLTAAVDVQRGSKNDPNRPPRLEMEVKGHGANYRTWSIIYKIFYGDVDIPLEGAWKELNDYARETDLIYKRKDGFEFQPVLVGVDCGDGTIMDVVYKFTGTWANTYPVSGFKELKKRKKEAIDEGMLPTNKNLRRYRLANFSGTLVYQINTIHYKHNLYGSLNIPRQEFGPQLPGFCEFPSDYPEKYFKMLTAEDRVSTGAFRDKGRQNETLDLDIYNRCLCDVHLGRVREKLMEKFKKSYTPDELRAIINYDYVFEYLAHKAGVKLK